MLRLQSSKAACPYVLGLEVYGFGLGLRGHNLGVSGLGRKHRVYSEFFVTLSPAVRHRTSFANQDSGGKRGGMASDSWYAHVLSVQGLLELRPRTAPRVVLCS